MKLEYAQTEFSRAVATSDSSFFLDLFPLLQWMLDFPRFTKNTIEEREELHLLVLVSLNLNRIET